MVTPIRPFCSKRGTAIKTLAAAVAAINTFVANVGGNVAPAPVLTHDEATWLVALSTTLASWRCS